MHRPTLKPRSLARRLVRSLGYEFRRVGSAPPPEGAPLPGASYVENPEVGPSNLAVKLQRMQEGGPFEWPDVVATNLTVARMIGDAKRIVELGAGTARFAYEVAEDPTVSVLCSEFDQVASEWARENRYRSNITYTAGPVLPTDGPFDLLVSLEVIEHVANYRAFLKDCTRLAPKAIFSTPNRSRSREALAAMPPAYPQHVREWTAGETYWVLRTFYASVELYAQPSPLHVGAIPVDVNTRLTPTIAICSNPLRDTPD